jgi:hypothetical protein
VRLFGAVTTVCAETTKLLDSKKPASSVVDSALGSARLSYSVFGCARTA